MKSFLEHSKWIGKKIYYYEEIDSTNLEAKRLAEGGAGHGTIVYAGVQSAGKGRRGRVWESRKGDSLLMSAILYPKLSPEKISMLTLVQALAVRRAIYRLAGVEALIKWPNDLVIGGKKLCGILTELVLEGRERNFVIIGTGINVKQTEFSRELQNMATSIFRENRKIKIEIPQLLEEICMEFEAYYDSFMKTEDLSRLQKEYNTYLVNKERQVRVLEPGNEYTGKALGINPLGELLVEAETKEIKRVFAGEVSVRGVYGYVQ